MKAKNLASFLGASNLDGEIIAIDNHGKRFCISHVKISQYGKVSLCISDNGTPSDLTRY